MRAFYVIVLSTFILSSIAFGNGAAIVDSHTPAYLRMDSSSVSVSVESQISITTTTQYFYNNTIRDTVKYAFPVPEGASVTQLRWRVNGVWRSAVMAGTPQDTTLPGTGTVAPNLLAFLGNTPILFPIPQRVMRDSTLAVELTYVQLLPYSMGNVTYTYPSDYHLIQPGPVIIQRFNFKLTSPRTIDSIRFLNQYTSQTTNYGDSAVIHVVIAEIPATQNFSVRYTLNASQLGLFSYSTFQTDSLVPDSLGRGFLTFIAEPAQDTSIATMRKVFTLMIDRSGSMTGTKMQQARDAATFIVNNLNQGDRFNLIDFDDVITSFRPGHVLYTPQTRDSALAYISGLTARNTTNIGGAFGRAIPHFSTSSDSNANIIIFLTDGQPTAGLTNTNALVAYVDSLVRLNAMNICIYSFGIGYDVNQQLLTLLASHNRGLANFLGNNELYSYITNFYLTIRNPVLINTRISFNPAVVSQVYPDTLPNLYRGTQMILAGRYTEPAAIQITLSGSAFGRALTYRYNIQLSDTSRFSDQYIPKVWAKRKIESLLVRYYALAPSNPLAQSLRAQVINISRAYGVSSPFTSFVPGSGGGGGNAVKGEGTTPVAFELIGNYPNPFNASTTIKLRLNVAHRGDVAIRIYNVLGQLVRTLHIHMHGAGTYSVVWNGMDEKGIMLGSGTYIYAVDLRNTVMVGRMSMLK